MQISCPKDGWGPGRKCSSECKLCGESVIYSCTKLDIVWSESASQVDPWCVNLWLNTVGNEFKKNGGKAEYIVARYLVVKNSMITNTTTNPHPISCLHCTFSSQSDMFWRKLIPSSAHMGVCVQYYLNHHIIPSYRVNLVNKPLSLTCKVNQNIYMVMCTTIRVTCIIT